VAVSKSPQTVSKTSLRVNAVLEALAKGDVHPAEALLNPPDKGDHEIRKRVFEELGKTHSNDSVRLLISMLKPSQAWAENEYWTMPEKGLLAIAGSADPTIVSFLLDSLVDALSSDELVMRSQKILKKLGGKALDKLMVSLRIADPIIQRRSSWLVGEILRYDKTLSEEQREKTLSQLYELVLDDDSAIRSSAGRVLLEIGDPRSLDYVLEWMEHEDLKTAVHALTKLQTFEDVKVIAPLVRFFERVRQAVRNQSLNHQDAEALQNSIGLTFRLLRKVVILDMAAVEPLADDLLEEAASSSGSERGAIAIRLVEIGHPKSVPALKKLLDRSALSDYAKLAATRFVAEHRDKWEPTEIMRCALCNIERPVTETRPYHDGTEVKYFCRDTCWEKRGRVHTAGIGKDCPYYAEGMCRAGDVSALCSLQVGHYKTDCHVYKMYPIH
jgi:HEAT repeat protein